MINNDIFNNAQDVILSRSKEQVFTDLQGEIVILNVKSGKYFSLNAVGSLIWRKIEQPTSLLSIIDAIIGEYNVDRQKCEEDVRNLLRKLFQAGLIEFQTNHQVE